jgi:hypothetical protein
MKRVWSAWILIASALLLSAASPTPRNQQQRQPDSQTSNTQASPSAPTEANRIVATQVRQATSAPETNGADIQSEEWYYRLYDHVWPPQWDTFFPPIWSNWAIIFVAVWAGYAAWRTVGEMRSQAEKQALDFDKSFAETREATRAATRQAKVSEDTLILTQRPRLIVRNVVVKRSENTVPPRPLFERGSPVSGQFYISNIGGTPARIIEIGCWVEWYTGNFPMERPYEGKDGYRLPTPIILQPSQSTPWTFISERIMGDEANKILFNNEGWGIIVLGWVAYRDDAGIERRTAFCRRWSVDRKRFMPVEDTDYQHEE